MFSIKCLGQNFEINIIGKYKKKKKKRKKKKSSKLVRTFEI